MKTNESVEYYIKSTLNPLLWENNKLKGDIGRVLLKAATSFYKSLDLTVPVEDILFCGSLANYNWNHHSDIDIHIVIDYSKVSDDEKIVAEYVKTKSDDWNKKHNITVEGFDLEFNLQDTDADLRSSGQWSILYEKWVSEPVELDSDMVEPLDVEKQFIYYSTRINDLVNEWESGIVQAEDLIEDIAILRDKIKEARTSSLAEGGELSTGNLVFKRLRDSGIYGKLLKLKNTVYDATLSYNSRVKDISPRIIESQIIPYTKFKKI